MLRSASVEYTSASGINVKIGLYLSHTFEGSVLPPMGPAVSIQNILIARPEDIVCSKIVAWMSREDDEDREDAAWGLRQLVARRGAQ